jgi:hypothetical protein
LNYLQPAIFLTTNWLRKPFSAVTDYYFFDPQYPASDFAAAWLFSG